MCFYSIYSIQLYTKYVPLNKPIDMDIQTRKIEFIEKFLKIQNEEIIFQFEEILNQTQFDEISKNQPLSEAELNRRIDQSESDFINNRYKSTLELLRKY